MKILPHPVDIQDHDGFLAHLDHQAQKGWELTRCYRAFGIFRRSGSETIRYALRMDPEGEIPSDVPGLPRALSIRKEWAPRDPVWESRLTDYYHYVFPCEGLALGRQVKNWLVMPAALFLLLFAQYGSGPDLWAMVVPVAVCAVLVIAGALLEEAIRLLHRRGLEQAAENSLPYRTPASWGWVVRWKNVLLTLFPLAQVVTILLCLWGVMTAG